MSVGVGMNPKNGVYGMLASTTRAGTGGFRHVPPWLGAQTVTWKQPGEVQVMPRSVKIRSVRATVRGTIREPGGTFGGSNTATPLRVPSMTARATVARVVM